MPRNAAGTPIGTIEWKDLPVGDAGYNLILREGVDLLGRPYQVKTTDVGGIVVRRFIGGKWTEWEQFISAATMGAGYGFPLANGAVGGAGCAGLDVCEGESAVGGFLYDGYLWLTTDGFLSASQTAWARRDATQVNANIQPGAERFIFGKVRIDPANSNVWYVYTKATGLERSTDRAANWSAIASVPVASTVNQCAFTGVVTGRILTVGSPTGTLVAGDQLIATGIAVAATTQVISFSGSIAGTALTTTGSPALRIGDPIFGTGVSAGTIIMSGSGNAWVVNNSQTVASTTMTVGNGVGGAGTYPINDLTYVRTFTGSITGTALTSTGGPSLQPGDLVFGTGVTPGTTIVSGSNNSWVVSAAQTVPSTTITVNSILSSRSMVSRFIDGNQYGVIEFKRGSGTTAVGGPTRTAGVFCHVGGAGLHESSNGGTSFALCGSGGPTLINCLDCDSTGRLYIGGYTLGYQYWAAGSFTNLGTFGMNGGARGIAVKPDNDDVVWMSDGTGAFRITRDRFGTTPIGGMWAISARQSRAPMIGFEQNRSSNILPPTFTISCNGKPRWVEGNSKIGTPHGYGYSYALYANVPTTNTTSDRLVFIEDTEGGNELVGHNAAYWPADATLTQFGLTECVEDRAFVGFDPPAKANGRRGNPKDMPMIGGLHQGWQDDWHWSAPWYRVRVGTSQSPQLRSFIIESFDYGNTWTELYNWSGNFHGCVTVMGERKLVLIRFGPAFVPLVWTGGFTPQSVQVSGADMTSNWAVGGSGLNGSRRVIVAANPNNPNEVAFYNGVSAGVRNIYLSSNGGVSASLAASGVLPSSQSYTFHSKLKWSRSGRLIITAGNTGSYNVDSAANLPEYSDNGSTWTPMTNIRQVNDFAFGAPATPGGPDATWAIAWSAAGVRDLYGSHDLGANWFPALNSPKIFDTPQAIAAHPTEYARLTIMKSGSGGVEGIYGKVIPA